MPDSCLSKLLAALLVVAVCSPVALADPPAHAPAHGWRAKHDPYYIGYRGRQWTHDFGIASGRCNREEIATVLGGVIGGAIGAKVADKDDRPVAILVGAVAGALIGNRIGRELDEADQSCVGHALEIGKPGQVVAWVNSDTGVEYQLALGSQDVQREDGCRPYSLLAIAGKKKSLRQGVACPTGSGTWALQQRVKT